MSHKFLRHRKQGRWKQFKSGQTPNTKAVQLLAILRAVQKKKLIELSGSSSQHEDVQSIYVYYIGLLAQMMRA